MPALMHLKVLLPVGIFVDNIDVQRIVVDTPGGSYGFLPHRLDCIAPMAPGILVYQTQDDGEVFVAVDQGVLVKTGLDVLVSVRRALQGSDLGELRQAVEEQFLRLDEHEQNVRAVVAKMEAGVLRRFVALHRE